MANVVVVHAVKFGLANYIAYHDYVLAAFARIGAIIVDEATFLRQPSMLGPDDKLVGFFLNDHNAARVFSYAKPENRWSYVIDERATPDGRAYHGRIEFCQRVGARRMIVVYQNERHLRCLRESGIDFIVFPCSVPRRRARTEKRHGVLAAGTFDPAAYTTRFRVRNLLARAEDWNNRVVHTSIEPAMGDKYYEILDQYELGITCRADYRDRMVQKYVEFGMCHVLPVGDCPTYMPADMKRLMVNVEGMSDDAILAEVRRLLNAPDERYARQEAYSELVHHYYDLETNARMVIEAVSRS